MRYRTPRKDESMATSMGKAFGWGVGSALGRGVCSWEILLLILFLAPIAIPILIIKFLFFE